MRDRRIILAGGSGFIGTMLARELIAREYEVIILSRGDSQSRFADRALPGTHHSSLLTRYWDGRTIGEWAECLEGARAVVNLAGRSVNCRHTAKNRREIVESRVNS